METGQIISYKEVQNELKYTIITPVEGQEEPEKRTVVTMIPQNEYMLGISDLTGELMRRAINSISSGDSEDCVFSGQVVRDLYTGFLGMYYDYDFRIKFIIPHHVNNCALFGTICHCYQ